MELKCKFVEFIRGVFPMIYFRHEGRSWYTSHRGRLWIHAAAKEPDQETIISMEEFYKSRNNGMINIIIITFL